MGYSQNIVSRTNRAKFGSAFNQAGLDTRSFFIMGSREEGGQARAETRALLDVCRSSAYLVQYEPDKPTTGLGLRLTRYIP